MTGLVFLIVFGMGLCCGALLLAWQDSPPADDLEVQRRMDKWDTR